MSKQDCRFSEKLCAICPTPTSLRHARALFSKKGCKLSTVIDSAGLLSFINDKTKKSLQLQFISSSTDVSMAMSHIKGEVLGCCHPDVTVKGKTYKDVDLYILINLCCDMLLGIDF